MGARRSARLCLAALAALTTFAALAAAAEQQAAAAAVGKQDAAKSLSNKPSDTHTYNQHHKHLHNQHSSAEGQQQQQQQQQQVAEKKQGDQANSADSSLFNTDEYVQIKPEEITKELDAASLALADLPASGSSAAAAVANGGSQPAAAQAAAAAAAAAPEHKSAADEELSAHLAQEGGELISSLESGPRPAAADPRAHYAPMRSHMPPPPPPRGHHHHARGPHRRPMAPAPGYGRGPRSPMHTGSGPHPYMHPHPQPHPHAHSAAAGYMALKGKIADGLSSMVPHAMPRPYGPGPPAPPPPPPHPAPMRPYHSNSRPTSAYHASSSSVAHPPRYLPRGAAAGYAAFREFVRAQAHRYKQQSVQQHQQAALAGSHEPLAYNAAPPPTAGYGSAPGQVGATESYRNAGGARPGKAAAAAAEHHHQMAQQTGYEAAAPSSGSDYAGKPTTSTTTTTTKVTVAQAYIPSPASAVQAAAASAVPATGGYGAGPTPAAAYAPATATAEAMNPVLAKLYGGHAPQGVGRPEYNKDYGMVIHYPQATVYTEPMTVDQLHKLAGSSIGQILEQLQYNLASGHPRDEANTLRAAGRPHHLGHGVSIHAKEYYAPGKGGHYVPTTAAVISTTAGGASPQESAYAASEGMPAQQYNSQQQQQSQQGYNSAAPQNLEAAAYGLRPELGSGYDRVKAAVAASSASAGNKYQQQQQPRHPNAAAEGPMNHRPYAAAEPLGHIANLIGSELESLYNKANSVLAKQMDPEIHAHVQAHLKSLTRGATQAAAGALKMTEHDHGSPLVLRPYQQQSGGGAPAGPMRHRAPRRPYGPGPAPQAHGGRRPTGPAGRHPGPGPRPSGPYGPQAPHPHPHHHPQRPRHAHQQQQQQQHQSAYSAAQEQAFQQQMQQMLSDFNLGEENYGAKSQPIQATNQGYPNKVMQKHYQQQQQQQQAHYQAQQQQQQLAAAHSYEHTEGLEIPQGPNDQIGEISELLDALKGSLEAHRPAEAAGYGQTGAPTTATTTNTKDHQGKLEDVRYLANTLGQVPSYAIQVPVGHSAAHHNHNNNHHDQQQQQQQHQPMGESAPYGESAAPKQTQGNEYAAGPHQQAYQQQQQQQVAVAGPQLGAYQAAPLAAHVNGYGSAPAVNHQAAGQTAIAESHAYQQPQPQQQQVEYAQQSAAAQEGAYGQYNQQQQPQQESYAGAQQASNGEYGKLLGELGYGQAGAEQQQQQATSYGQQQHQHQQQPQGPAAYQQQQTVEHHQPQVHAEPQQQQQAYSTSEHTQVINHLVPAQQQQQQPQQPLEHASQPALQTITTSVAQQHLHQISVAAPTESQYQSAQPLSSFVDSLPSDYQELLRQPAHASILDGATHDALYSGNASVAASHEISKTSSPAHHHSYKQHHQNKYHSEQAHQLAGAASSVSSTYQKVESSAGATKSAAAAASPASSSSSASGSSSSPSQSVAAAAQSSAGSASASSSSKSGDSQASHQKK